jgi:hypothetical protein
VLGNAHFWAARQTCASAPIDSRRVGINRYEPAGVAAVVPLRRSERGSSGSFLARADDGRRYWCKVLDNLQSPRVPANEQIVGRLGALVGAPVCEVELVYIPEDLAGWEYRDGRPLTEGWAHGSLAVEPVVETNALDDRPGDDNARRHAGVFALFDWVGGSDPQWLVRGLDGEYFSHDHGHYFPGGPAWTIDGLRAAVATPYQPPGPTSGLDPAELRRLADAIESAGTQEIEGCVAKIPATWPVADEELDAVVEFVVARRGPVAERLRALVEAV